MVNLSWKYKENSIKKLKRPRKFYSFYKESSDFKSEWTNKLFWGDNLDTSIFLLKDFENKIDLIYIDPPFFTGSNYSVIIEEDGKDFGALIYEDQWNNDLDSYLQMLYTRILNFRKLLSNKGLLFIHLDWHASHYVRVILDEVFGRDKFVNSIVWYYYNKYSAGKKALPRSHDDILVYSKTDDYELNELRLPRKKPIKQLKRVMVDGVLKNAKDENGHVIYRIVNDKKMDDVWKIPCLQPASKEWTGFPNQKHHNLLERIIKIGSKEGDLIADFFCGSGTSLIMAEKLNRRWIGSDISKYAINICINRIKEFNKKSGLNHSFNVFSDNSKEKIAIINNSFFNKEIKLKRK